VEKDSERALGMSDSAMLSSEGCVSRRPGDSRPALKLLVELTLLLLKAELPTGAAAEAGASKPTSTCCALVGGACAGRACELAPVDASERLRDPPPAAAALLPAEKLKRDGWRKKGDALLSIADAAPPPSLEMRGTRAADPMRAPPICTAPELRGRLPTGGEAPTVGIIVD